MGAPQISYLQCPSTIVNEAIDSLGQPGKIIGDITDGTTVAETARRNYGQALRQLLATAHWGFARKRAKLTLLGDATGNPIPAGVSPFVECPWAYAYGWPIDAVQGRWLPWTPINAQPETPSGVPLTTGVSALTQYPMQPGRFLVSSSDQYPIVTGVEPWEQLPDLQRTEGLGYTSRKVILTDCCQAEFVYTKFEPTIEVWDALFRQALVTMMAMILAPVAIDDPKISLAERVRLSPTLRNAIADARVASNNEAGYPMTTDFEASFIRARNWGGYWAPGSLGLGIGGGGLGTFWGGFDSMSWCGSVY